MDYGLRILKDVFMKNKEIKLTIVTCYNNKTMLNELIKSINSQNCKCNIILIDNTDNKYKSCSEAFNKVMCEVKTRFVLFVHQDVIFDKKDMLEQIISYLEMINAEDIVGMAGAIYENGKQKIYSNIRNKNGITIDNVETFNGIIQCDSIDECIFGGYASFFKENKFDTKICNGWHLYAVERCLFTQTKNGKVYVCDVPIIHISPGYINYDYCMCFYRLCCFYNKFYKRICAPCYCYKTKIFLREISLIKSLIKVFIGGGKI